MKHLVMLMCAFFIFSSNAEAKRYYGNDTKISSRYSVGPKPGKWCGWYARQIFGGGPEYNLARNWAKRGRASHAKVGAVVVWRNHVGYISGRSAKGWVITSGNDGNRVRSRVRSLHKVIAIRDLS